MDLGLERLLASTRAVKALRIAAIVQDLADSVIAVNDIRGRSGSVLVRGTGAVRSYNPVQIRDRSITDPMLG